VRYRSVSSGIRLCLRSGLSLRFPVVINTRRPSEAATRRRISQSVARDWRRNAAMVSMERKKSISRSSGEMVSPNSFFQT